jgi:hypothetical protein
VRIAFSTVSAPPARFIGSELMTLRLTHALVDAGHDVTVHPTITDGQALEHEGVRIMPSAIPADVDVIVCHADYGIRARKMRRRTGAPVVAICHNAGTGVKVGLVNSRPALTIVNSETMREALGVDALVVNPPAPPVRRVMPGRCVTALSLNELKGGRQFWQIAALLPRIPFLGVRGGYGDQIVGGAPNARVLEHVPPGELERRVWRHAGIFLQLSESESWGMAAAEAIAHGVPVIAHPTPGLEEHLGNAAVWVDREDVEGIAEAILTILGSPAPFRATALARAAENAARSVDQVAAWVAAIDSLGGEHGRSASARDDR